MIDIKNARLFWKIIDYSGEPHLIKVGKLEKGLHSACIDFILISRTDKVLLRSVFDGENLFLNSLYERRLISTYSQVVLPVIENTNTTIIIDQPPRHPQLPKSIKNWGFYLPLQHREEILGDISELTNEMKLAGLSKFKIKCCIYFHFTLAMFGYLKERSFFRKKSKEKTNESKKEVAK